MISSQNNVQKYRTKGHEQVFWVRPTGLELLKQYSELVTGAVHTWWSAVKPKVKFFFLPLLPSSHSHSLRGHSQTTLERFGPLLTTYPWTSLYWTAKSSFSFLTSDQLEACYFGPKLHTGGGFFGPWFFIILKKSHKDLSNEGSNFILSSLEVGHWAAQTQAYFDKLPEITDFVLLQQSQNRARFWIC